MPWPRSPDGQRAFLEDVIRVVRESPRGLGVLWWGPEAIPAPGASVWKGGAAALFDGEGRPLPAMEAFREDAPPDPVTVHVFHRQPVRFAPENAAHFDTAEIRAADNGREIERTVTLPAPAHPVRVLARVRLHPIPKDAASVCDPWDRAGNVRLVAPGRPDVEVVKFITAYGGATTHEVDVTNLAPLLRGQCTFRGFVDTWLDPAWRIDFELVFEPADTEPPPAWMQEWLDPGDRRAPDWVIPLMHETITRELMDGGDVTAKVTIPPGAERMVLEYLVSGHCTDGRDADEFVAKDNVITVDGEEAHRFRPWRDDCRSFRDVNPYCRRWFDGTWSADFSRSGWCPGDAVRPVPIDLTGRLSAGEHVIGFRVEDVRAKDEGGHGYWRVSARLVGWSGR
jgi:hypothetical protein